MADKALLVNTMELFSLRGRVAVVTGGAGLLGPEICKALLDAEAAVAIADKDYRRAIRVAKHLTRDCTSKVEAFRLDVTSPADIDRFFRDVIRRFKAIDVLVNAAANNPQPTKRDLSRKRISQDFVKSWQADLETNLSGVYYCCQAAASYMAHQGRGVIINLASMYGIVAPDQRLYEGLSRSGTFSKPPSYSASKSGVLGLTRHLAACWASQGIRVNALSLGGVFNRQHPKFVRRYCARVPMARMAFPEEVRGPLVFLASDASSYMTGANLVVDGGWTIW